MSRFDPRLFLGPRAPARWLLCCAVCAATVLAATTALAASVPGAPSLGFQRALARDLGIARAVAPRVAHVGSGTIVAGPRRRHAAPAPVGTPAPAAAPSPAIPVVPAVKSGTSPIEVTPVRSALPPPAALEPTPPAPEPEPTPPVPEPEPMPPAPEPEPTPPVVPVFEPALLEANFEQGLDGWSTAGVGEVVPTGTSEVARTGSASGRVVLTGNQNRSELIFGGNGSGGGSGTVEIHEGDEYWYGFSFDIRQMVYGKPGAHNLIMQFKSDGEGSPNFGLQLWDFNGRKGLWTGGPSQETNHGGERFLAPVAENAWHDVQIHFKASSAGAGFYEVFLDGALVDSKTGVSMIVPGHGYAYIKDGLYRNGETIPGTSEIDLDAAKLGETRNSVLPWQ